MDITSKNQEEISFCYFNAVVAKANAISNRRGRDEDGFDSTVTKKVTLSNGKVLDASIFFQLKSVYSKDNYHFDSESNLVYKLDAKNYNDLVRPGNMVKYLVVLILPEEQSLWVEQNIDCLIIRKCMYFISLNGLPETRNASTVSITLPKDNVFNAENLNKLLVSLYE